MADLEEYRNQLEAYWERSKLPVVAECIKAFSTTAGLDEASLRQNSIESRNLFNQVIEAHNRKDKSLKIELVSKLLETYLGILLDDSSRDVTKRLESVIRSPKKLSDDNQERLALVAVAHNLTYFTEYSHPKNNYSTLLTHPNFLIHRIPKVSSNSISFALQGAFGIDEDQRRAQNSFVDGLTELVTPSELESRSCYRCAFVRNPYDRLVSCYTDKLNPERDRTSFSFRTAGFFPDMSFEEFVRRVSRNPMANFHFTPQTELIRSNGQLPDFIGRFEQLSEGWEELCAILRSKYDDSVFSPQPLPHRNPSQRKEYRDYYNDKTRALAENIYAEDLEAFGYSYL